MQGRARKTRTHTPAKNADPNVNKIRANCDRDAGTGAEWKFQQW